MLYKRILTTLAAILLALTMSQSLSARWGGGGGGQDNLSQDEIDDILFMREEEKLARDSYFLLGDEYGLTIFSNISESEQSHMDAMKKLIDKYGLTDPVGEEDIIGGYQDLYLVKLLVFLMDWGFQSELDALYVGGAIEETDILDIQHAIERASHSDIIETYESLLCGSRNHLRSFVRQIELVETPYERFILTKEQFDEIMEDKLEQDCSTTETKKRQR
jgi:hypothetical protein